MATLVDKLTESGGAESAGKRGITPILASCIG